MPASKLDVPADTDQVAKSRAEPGSPTVSHKCRPTDQEVRMFTAHISTKPGGSLEIAVFDAEDCYLAELLELLRLETERRVRELEAMSDARLFDIPERDR